MSFYTQYRNKKILNRLKILFVITFMGILFFNVIEAHAAEKTHTVKTVSYEEMVSFMNEQKQRHKKIETDTAFFKYLKINTSWISEAPGF